MTTAHALVITHHDFKTYPSWVSSLTHFHFLEAEFQYSCIFNVPASIAGSGSFENLSSGDITGPFNREK